MKKTPVSSRGLHMKTKKAKYLILSVRILWIVFINLGIIFPFLLTEEDLSIPNNEINAHNIHDKYIIKNDELFHKYREHFLINNLICGVALILICFANILLSCNLILKNKFLKDYEPKIMLTNLNLQLLFISFNLFQSSDTQNFFCKVQDYTYWFESYNSTYVTSLFIERGKRLCKTYTYSMGLSLFFYVFSLIEFLLLYFRIQRPFRKKYIICCIKSIIGIIFLCLLYYYGSNKHFFNTTLKKRNTLNYEQYEEQSQIILFSTQKQKYYYFNLLLAANAVSAIIFLSCAYYDIVTIISASKLFMLINICICICFLIIQASQSLLSTYMLEASFFFCHYSDYFIKLLDPQQMDNQNTSLLSSAPQSDITETLWFCNMYPFLYVYMTNVIVGFLIYAFDLGTSLYMMFSKKYA